MPLQIRRGNTSERLSIVPSLGELIFDTVTNKVYVGDGTTVGGINITESVSDESIRDISASLLTAGTHQGIIFSYDDDNDKINTTIDLNGTISGNVIPDSSEAYDLGSSTAKFRDLYLSGTSLFLGDAVITSTGNSVNLPAGSTVGGTAIGSGSGGFQNFKVAADDSTEITINSGETIQFVGTNNVTTTSDSEGKITISLASPLQSDILGGLFHAQDSTLLIDGINGVIPAENISGTFTGTLNGGVFTSDGLTAIIDSNIGSITTPSVVTDNITVENVLRVINEGDASIIHFDRVNAGDTAVTTSDSLGNISFRGYDGSGNYKTGSRISSFVDSAVGSGMPCSMLFQINDSTDNLTTYLSLRNDFQRVDSFKPFYIVSSDYQSTGALFGIYQYHDTVDASNISISRGRGTDLAPASVQNGDDISDISFLAHNGSFFSPAISVSAVVDGNVIGSNVPGKLIIRTNNGSTGTVERLSINSLGIIEVNGTLNVVGDASISGSVTTDLIGSVFSGSSSMLIDGTDGSLMVANVNIKGETGNAPSNTGTVDSWLEITVNGATKYMPLYA